MLLESGAAMNLSGIGHHLLALRPAISIATQHAPETGCTGNATYDEDRSQVTSIAAALCHTQRPSARPTAANDHETLTNDFAEALT